jgi:hypothetical protein
MNIHREIISAIEIWSHSIISVLLGNNIYFASTSNRGFVTGWDNTGYVPPPAGNGGNGDNDPNKNNPSKPPAPFKNQISIL